ncbi:serine/threonine protein kinase [Labilithrix luteola]|uniref:Serine/threonine protein kinase n=1 Tax=Labilithrix luteola TaxID=1391654 RepID=A0A0K1Q9L0_9BACT|nr:serine/threonine-protein kinase [Labilithrix luteola]AKV02347.1 serine/threonine protein kinase [Labilithrix luteola]
MARSDGNAPRTVGRYVLYGELAAGGMATVHFGRLSGPVGFSRTVAIKRLHPQFAKDPEFVTMFLDEARLCGRIRHPNVVPTLDVVATAGEIFIVMEYVSGEALSKLLKTAWQKGIQIPPRVAATILSSVLHGLHAAHQTKDEHGRELGIVHRDVSPQNILVGADGVARVLDFGVAKAAGRTQTTRDGQVKGKIAYMPPEQLSGGQVTRQSDIYAASVVLWEAVAGRRLFDGETEAIVLVRAIEGKVDPPSTYRPELTPEADRVILKGLAREPADRFATAREMAMAIEQTIGLASPSEVGEWVELVAADELGRRAARIAEIESASVNGHFATMGSPPMGSRGSAVPGEPPHSQVSSISVSRAAISISPPAKYSRNAKLFTTVAAMLAVLGVGLGALSLDEVLGAHRRTGTPNVLERESRGIALIGPAMGPSRYSAPAATPSGQSGAVTFGRSTAAQQQAQQAAQAAQQAAQAAAQKAKNCEPPYTIDPATGHKKYKLECMGK